MQSVRSQQVQKPVLQQAMPLTQPDRIQGGSQPPHNAQPPPPTYEKAITEKRNHQPSSSPVIVQNQSPLPNPRTVSPMVGPPPPPYPKHHPNLVNPAGKQKQPPVINSATVVSTNKPVLYRKNSPSETTSSSASRSESPISETISSDNTTVSCSPSRLVIFQFLMYEILVFSQFSYSTLEYFD